MTSVREKSIFHTHTSLKVAVWKEPRAPWDIFLLVVLDPFSESLGHEVTRLIEQAMSRVQLSTHSSSPVFVSFLP